MERVHRLRNLGPPRGLILAYHRIAEPPFDPFRLCVSPRNFREHIDILRRRFRPLRLQEITENLSHGAGSQRGVVITLDDGYADNWTEGMPSLERYDFPATVFAVSDYVMSQREFWWDELERILLQPGKLPEKLALQVDEKAWEWDLEVVDHNEEVSRIHRRWRFDDRTLPRSRHRLFQTIYRLLRGLSHECRQGILDQLSTWAGVPSVQRQTHRVLSATELRALAESGLVEVGSHTATHPDCSRASIDQEREVREGKRMLQEITGGEITSFAYPYGRHNLRLVSSVQSAGFNCACSIRAGSVWRDSNPFLLPRVEIGDWDGETFARTISPLI